MENDNNNNNDKYNEVESLFSGKKSSLLLSGVLNSSNSKYVNGLLSKDNFESQ